MAMSLFIIYRTFYTRSFYSSLEIHDVISGVFTNLEHYFASNMLPSMVLVKLELWSTYKMQVQFLPKMENWGYNLIVLI